MLRRITRDILRDDEFRAEIKSNFIGDDLGDDFSFRTQCEKFKDYKFETYFNEIHELYNYESVSFALFYYVYEIGNNKNLSGRILMYQTKLSISDNDRTIIELETIDRQNEENINLIDVNVESITSIKIMVSIETTFYKMIIGEYNQDEDDYESEEEYNDYLPTLELPFFQDKCVVCIENKPSILILPCKHICHCVICDEEGLINKCPMCREKIDRKLVITK